MAHRENFEKTYKAQGETMLKRKCKNSRWWQCPPWKLPHQVGKALGRMGWTWHKGGRWTYDYAPEG